jgi:hypothetical protein
MARRKGFFLSAPKTTTWLICVILGAAGLLGQFGGVQALAQYSFWLLAVGWGLLVLATALEGL